MTFDENIPLFQIFSISISLISFEKHLDIFHLLLFLPTETILFESLATVGYNSSCFNNLLLLATTLDS